MKKILITTLLLLSFQMSRSEEVTLLTTVQEVTIYHSGASVSRTSSQKLTSGIHHLVLHNVSSKILLNSLKISNKEVTILNKSMIRKLTEEEFNQLIDKKEAIRKQMDLIEAKYNEVGFVTDVVDLEKMTEFYAEKMMYLKKSLRNVELSIAEAKDLENIKLKNENAGILKLVVSVDQLKGPIQLQYICGGIGWSPAYDISVESPADRTIHIKYMAKAMSQTGEDWDNIRINLSSSFPLEPPTSLPKPDAPWILSGRSFQSPSHRVQQQGGDQGIIRLEGIDYQEISIPSSLKMRSLPGKYSLKSNSTVFTFPITSVELPTSYYYFGFPAIDAEPYLVAEIVGWDTLGFVDGVASVSYAGNDVGKSLIKFSETSDTLLLPVGKDNSVFMVRSEMEDQKYFKVSSPSKKRKTTLAYEFTLKNNNSFPVEFFLADQVPISQTKYAEVSIGETSNGNLSDETGEVSWRLNLKPGELISKQLIFTIEMDSDYSYRSGPSMQKYRKLSAPTF